MERGNMTDAEYIVALENERKMLTSEIKEKNIQLKDRQVEIETMKKQLHIYIETIILCKRKIFGSSSEKTEIPDQLSFFNEAEKEYTDKPVEPISKTVKGYTRKNPKSHRDELIKGIETEIVDCTIPEEERICPRCGSKMVAMGKKFVREEVEIIPAKLIKKRFFTTAYECKKCRKMNKPVIINAFVPMGVLPHSLCSASTVAWVMYQKYVNAMPLYRQEKEWERLGYSLSRSTMANWVIKCCDYYFDKFVERLKAEMLKQEVLHADETYVKVLKEENVSANSKQYMWVYRTGKYSEKPVVIYDYNKSRSGEIPQNFLKGFNGYLHTDGYAGYNRLNVTRCSCWAHLRRKFHEAMLVESEESLAKLGRDYCDELFRIEKELENLTNEKRYEQRLTQEKPVFEAFWLWINENSVRALKGTQLSKAFIYAVNQRENLSHYFLDGRCSISNNVAENSIRPFTVGRKNWLFSDSKRGAKASATIYSLVETAKANGLDVFKYLELLLTVLPSSEFATNTDIFEDLLPWNDKVRSLCGLK